VADGDGNDGKLAVGAGACLLLLKLRLVTFDVSERSLLIQCVEGITLTFVRRVLLCVTVDPCCEIKAQSSSVC
jgi:hypothetical protein